MSEHEHNEIIYEEGWRDNAPLTDDVPPVDEVPAPQEKEPAPKPLLISIQLVVCLIAALVLFLLKAMDSPAFHGFMTWYKVEMNHPVISQELFTSLSASRLSTPDEVTVKASPDELPPR